MTTHPEDTITNFPRDMQWGQAIQLIEDHMQASVDLNLDLARTLLTQSQNVTDWFSKEKSWGQWQKQNHTRRCGSIPDRSEKEWGFTSCCARSRICRYFTSAGETIGGASFTFTNGQVNSYLNFITIMIWELNLLYLT